VKIVILGSQGQLGSALVRVLGPRHAVTGLGHAELDVLDRPKVREALTALRPELVINTTAYVQVDKAEDEVDAAFALNARAVLDLARTAAELDCTLVQVSTDYVYGLEKGRSTPYRETDVAGPVGVYGQSKLAGEDFVRAYAPKHFVVRSAGLYEPIGSRNKGGNFLETMLKLAAAKKSLKVVADQISTPTYASDLAAGIAELIQSDRYGLYHLTNAGEVSWFDFAKEIFRQAKVDADLSPTTAAAYGAKAKRPAYSVLDNGKINQLVNPLRPWQEALGAYLAAR
jgi:dTDP-4-dehydrorhamnose reductase